MKMTIPAAAGARGFTLVEMMIAIAVMAILLAVAVPSFNDALLGNRLAAHANSLVASVALARGEAIKRNGTVTLCASADGVNCSSSGGWEQGWIVKSSAGVLQRQQALTTGLTITQAGGTAQLSFDATGLGATAATLTVCRATPPGSQQRMVSIASTGRATVTRTGSASCA
jgi:type IV fimbrial biogenesis protein FimT